MKDTGAEVAKKIRRQGLNRSTQGKTDLETRLIVVK